MDTFLCYQQNQITRLTLPPPPIIKLNQVSFLYKTIEMRFHTTVTALLVPNNPSLYPGFSLSPAQSAVSPPPVSDPLVSPPAP